MSRNVRICSFWKGCLVKIQISLRMCTVWSESSSLSAIWHGRTAKKCTVTWGNKFWTCHSSPKAVRITKAPRFLQADNESWSCWSDSPRGAHVCRYTFSRCSSVMLPHAHNGLSLQLIQVSHHSLLRPNLIKLTIFWWRIYIHIELL